MSVNYCHYVVSFPFPLSLAIHGYEQHPGAILAFGILTARITSPARSQLRHTCQSELASRASPPIYLRMTHSATTRRRAAFKWHCGEDSVNSYELGSRLALSATIRRPATARYSHGDVQLTEESLSFRIVPCDKMQLTKLCRQFPLRPFTPRI